VKRGKRLREGRDKEREEIKIEEKKTICIMVLDNFDNSCPQVKKGCSVGIASSGVANPGLSTTLRI
jgi:hypothetical protein